MTLVLHPLGTGLAVGVDCFSRWTPRPEYISRFVLTQSVGVRLSPRPIPHACGIARTSRPAASTRAGLPLRSRLAASRLAASQVDSQRITWAELRLLAPHSVSRVRHPTVGGVRLSSTPSHMTCATDAGAGQQRKGGVNARQGHQGNGFKGQGGLGRRRRFHRAAQAGLDCGRGGAAAGGTAGDRRRRAGLPERGRPRTRRAAAHAVRQAQWQAADGTDATGDEGAPGATDDTSNTTRRRTR